MIGKEILNYRITNIIGQGGMGVVYAATNKYIQEQKVAIKMINHDMLNDFTRDRLEQEAHRLASLNHPNIVGLINFHKDEKGNVFLIMEYAEGISIDKYLNEVHGLVVEEDICALFDPILDGIGYAHKHRDKDGKRDPIIHCDIKPANIIVYPGESSRVKILDLGIAQIVSQQDRDTQLVMGTPSYMSPEQVKGEKLDERSDIYSLGVLLHQMLTGNAPYDTTTLTEHEINEKVIVEPLPRMQTYYKYISDAVQQVVDKATAKAPSDRYQSCEEFKKALHKAIYPYKMSLWTKAGIAAMIAFIVGAGIWAWDYNRTKVTYYKDYVEQWGIPQGISKLSSSEHSHAQRSFMFVSKRGRLLRVAYVNSTDHLVPSSGERPSDQEFFYTDDGRVNRVKVKNPSGKILYVKSFNEKGNVVTFQYDDENNTECVLPKSFVGTNMNPADEDEHGRISRMLVEYDNRGYITKEQFRDFAGLPASDDNGIYGITYVRDLKGRTTEVHYTNADGKPHSMKSGLSITTHEYDPDGNKIKTSYLSADRSAVRLDGNGAEVVQMTYDKYGNLLNELYQHADSKPMLCGKGNIAGIKHAYDKRGNCIQTDYLDLNLAPTYNSDEGCASKRREFDDNGYIIKRTLCDTDGKPSPGTDRVTITEWVVDEHGNDLERWYKDEKGEMVTNTDGIAGSKWEYDSVGNMTKVIYYDTERKPTIHAEYGDAGVIWEYNERGFISKRISLGVNLKPASDFDNEIITCYEYDNRGNVTKVAHYDTDGTTPRLNNDGIASQVYKYDDNGYYVEVQYYNDKGLPAMSFSRQTAKEVYGYDENGNICFSRFFNASGKPTLVDGVAGYDYIKDRNGHILERKPIGLNGRLASGQLIFRQAFDSLGYCTEQTYFNNSGPALDDQGVHRYTWTFNGRGQVMKSCRYDTKNRLTLNKEGYAITVSEYNERGEEIRWSLYGTDQKPCMHVGQFSSYTVENDEYGNVVKECYFGVDGKPTAKKVHPPIIVYKFDNRGNRIYSSLQDENGQNYIDETYHYSIYRGEFDLRNNRTSIAFYDPDNKPMLHAGGYHKENVKYNAQNKVTEMTYYDTSMKPCTCKDGGFHKVLTTYDEHSGKEVMRAYYGTTGKPVNYYGDWHKYIITYATNGAPLSRKYYAANGSYLSAETWDGKKWR